MLAKQIYNPSRTKCSFKFTFKIFTQSALNQPKHFCQKWIMAIQFWANPEIQRAKWKKNTAKCGMKGFCQKSRQRRANGRGWPLLANVVPKGSSLPLGPSSSPFRANLREDQQIPFRQLTASLSAANLSCFAFIRFFFPNSQKSRKCCCCRMTLGRQHHHWQRMN